MGSPIRISSWALKFILRFLHCDNRFLPCDNKFLPCDNKFLHCDNKFLHCGNRFLDCDNKFLHCDFVGILYNHKLISLTTDKVNN